MCNTFPETPSQGSPLSDLFFPGYSASRCLLVDILGGKVISSYSSCFICWFLFSFNFAQELKFPCVCVYVVFPWGQY